MEIYKIGIVSVFCLSGLAINIMLKLLHKQQFIYSSVIYFIQCLIIFIISSTMIAFKNSKKQKKKKTNRIIMNLKLIKSSFLLLLFYTFHGYFQISANQKLDLTLYLAGRRATTFFVVISKILLCDLRSLNKSMIVSSFLIFISGLLAILNSLDGNFQDNISYSLLILANTSTVVYAELNGSFQRKTRMNQIDLLQMNSQNSLLMVIILMIANNDIQQSFGFLSQLDDSQSLQLIIGFLVSMGILVFSQQYCHYLCTKHIGTFTVMFVGNLKDLLATIISIHYFKEDILLDTFTIVNIVVSFLATFGYCFYKYFDQPHRKPDNTIPLKQNNDVQLGKIRR